MQHHHHHHHYPPIPRPVTPSTPATSSSQNPPPAAQPFSVQLNEVVARFTSKLLFLREPITSSGAPPVAHSYLSSHAGPSGIQEDLNHSKI
ncbi:hypothetical protein B9Z55_004943 [Caenorhabditis nigoni]|uniref:Uncharacterized protein n=1 Tax=Caenorhabditis nigoni TaxID=1611254 RepID=A0A2G5UYZ1_9PELO|nr:hypothetical protein B9Z55_004943 [Caenorhabditis nigoni]